MKRILKIICLASLLLSCFSKSFTQSLPFGYIEQYSDKCTSETFFKKFLPEESTSWKFITANEKKVLSFGFIDTVQANSFPQTRGVIKNMIFGDYILEFEYKAKKFQGENEGFCVLGPVKTNNTYYVIRFSSDSVSFLFLNNGVFHAIESQSAPKIIAGWNKVKIERDILNRRMIVTINGNLADKNIFTDLNLVMGFVGFGAHDASCQLRNIKLWAPTSIDSVFVWH